MFILLKTDIPKELDAAAGTMMPTTPILAIPATPISATPTTPTSTGPSIFLFLPSLFLSLLQIRFLHFIHPLFHTPCLL